MVTAVTSMGRSGLYDWMMQRVTAVILLAYFCFLHACSPVVSISPPGKHSIRRPGCGYSACSHCCRWAFTPGWDCGRYSPTT